MQKIKYVFFLLILCAGCTSKENSLLGDWKIEEIKISKIAPDFVQKKIDDLNKEIKGNAILTFKTDSSFSFHLKEINKTGKWKITNAKNPILNVIEGKDTILYQINELTADKLVYQTKDQAEPILFYCSRKK